jgi:hypothetical protein
VIFGIREHSRTDGAENPRFLERFFCEGTKQARRARAVSRIAERIARLDPSALLAYALGSLLGENV